MSYKPTLLIIAAGMGSRYGGLKQIDPVGPSGEVVLDYSVYDAIRAGFGKVVEITTNMLKTVVADLSSDSAIGYLRSKRFAQRLQELGVGRERPV